MVLRSTLLTQIYAKRTSEVRQRSKATRSRSATSVLTLSDVALLSTCIARNRRSRCGFMSPRHGDGCHELSTTEQILPSGAWVTAGGADVVLNFSLRATARVMVLVVSLRSIHQVTGEGRRKPALRSAGRLRLISQ